jgi:hypothetical protein
MGYQALVDFVAGRSNWSAHLNATVGGSTLFIQWRLSMAKKSLKRYSMRFRQRAVERMKLEGLPPAGTFGNLGRNTVTAPGFSNVAFTVVKTTPLAEEKKLEFRAEFFDLFNHANFGLPVASIFNSSQVRSGNAGRLRSTATDNRQAQLGLKYIF